MADAENQAQAQAQAAAEGSLLEEILQHTKLKPSDEGYEIAKKGVEAFIAELIAPKAAFDKADKRAVDLMIAEIDKKLSRQVDELSVAAEP